VLQTGFTISLRMALSSGSQIGKVLSFTLLFGLHRIQNQVSEKPIDKTNLPEARSIIGVTSDLFQYRVVRFIHYNQVLNNLRNTPGGGIWFPIQFIARQCIEVLFKGLRNFVQLSTPTVGFISRLFL
jgi:hypothetical protein